MAVEASAAFSMAGERKRRLRAGDFTRQKKWGSAELSILLCGFGCKASEERMKRAVAETKPDLTILCGCCGACKPDISAGDFIGFAKGDVAEKLKESLGIQTAKIASSKKIVQPNEKFELGKMGFDGVDMEGELLESILKGSDSQFLHIRIINEGVKTELPSDFLDSIMDFESGDINISAFKLLASFAKNPRLLYKLPKFSASVLPVQKKYSRFIEKKLMPSLATIS